MVFEVDTFLINPVVEEFGKLKRSELLVLARYFELEVESSMRKQEIKNILIECLVETNIY